MNQVRRPNICNRTSAFPWLAGILLILALAMATMWTIGRREAAVQSSLAARAARFHPAHRSGRPSTGGLNLKDPRPGTAARRDAEVHADPGDVLATVNGTPVRVANLASSPRGDETVAMSNRDYRSRLQRAIDTELVFQEASARRIGLTARQQARLDRLAPGHEADLMELAPIGITWDSLGEGQIAFEYRLLHAMLLRQNLVAADAGVVPSPDREAQAAYEVALRELITRLRSAAQIEIGFTGR